MAALSAVVFALSWWLGLYLLARDPRKPVLVLAALGLTSFALVVALDAVRLVAGSETLSRIEIYLVAVPGIAWFAVLLELSRPREKWRSRAGEIALVAVICSAAGVEQSERGRSAWCCTGGEQSADHARELVAHAAGGHIG